MADDSDTERELAIVREQHNIASLANIERQKRIAVTRAVVIAKQLCPSAPLLYAAKLLGASRSSLRRLKIKYGLGGDTGE